LNRTAVHYKLSLEGEIEGLRAPTAELQSEQEGKAEATIAAPKKNSEAEGQWRASCRRVRVVAAAAPDGRDSAALRTEQLASDRVQACQDRLDNSAGFSEGDHVWQYRLARNRGGSNVTC
jgi:hypothetical protein